MIVRHARDPKNYHWSACGRAFSEDVRAASTQDQVTCSACRTSIRNNGTPAQEITSPAALECCEPAGNEISPEHAREMAEWVHGGDAIRASK